MDSCLEQVIEIENVERFFEQNCHNVYIFKTIGVPDFDDEDEIGVQIKKMYLEHKFNINETIVLRTFSNKWILIYTIMTNSLLLLKFAKPVLNYFIIINNIIVFYIDKNLEIIDIVNWKKKKYIIEKFSFDILYESTESFLKDKSKTDLVITKTDLDILLSTPDIIEETHNTFLINGQPFHCEKLWSKFALQKEDCYTISIIENKKRIFNYIITLENSKETKIFTLKELIDFLHNSFYQVIKDRVFFI